MDCIKYGIRMRQLYLGGKALVEIRSGRDWMQLMNKLCSVPIVLPCGTVGFVELVSYVGYLGVLNEGYAN